MQKSIKDGKIVELKFGDENRYEQNEKPKVMFFKEFEKEKSAL